MTSNATYSRTITVDAPDFASKAVSFSLLTSVAIDAANNEVFPRKEYSLTLDGSGTGSIALPCPDNSGAAAWAWRVELPDGRDVTTTMAYAGTSLDLSDWLTAEATTETASTIQALVSGKADKVSGATADNLAGLDANGNLQDSGYGVLDEDGMASDSATDVPTQQSVKAYVDAQIGTVDDVSELTTTGLTATNMLRVAAAGGLEERTPAQVLSDIGAAAASHTHGAGDIASGTLVHERGGLEADVSAYAGLVKISGGSTSAVTVTAFGESLIDDADASTARTTLGLGTMATEATGSYLAATGATTGATSQAQTFTNGVVTGANGLDVNPGSDTDADLITVGVTGTPKVSWSETNDAFLTSKKLAVNNAGLGGQGLDVFVGTDSTPAFVCQHNALANGSSLFQLVGGNAVTGIVDIFSAAASATATLQTVVQQNGAGDARNVLRVLGAGDALTTWEINGGQAWGAGLDNSDGDKFKIDTSAGGYLSTGAYFTIDTTSLTGINANSPAAQLHVDQSSATAAVPVLLLDQADDSEEMIEFTGTVGTGNAIEAVGAKTLTTTHFIKCTITGVGTVYFPVGTIA